MGEVKEVEELREVLERVEGKLIAAGKLYGAVNFGIWLSVMMLYYVIIEMADLPRQFNLVYWPVAFMVALWFTERVWRRFQRLGRVAGNKMETSKSGGILIALSWIAGGATLGWVVIPEMNLGGVNAEASLAVGSWASYPSQSWGGCGWSLQSTVESSTR